MDFKSTVFENSKQVFLVLSASLFKNVTDDFLYIIELIKNICYNIKTKA